MGAYTVCKRSGFHGIRPTPVAFRIEGQTAGDEADWPSLVTARWEV
jgi:hypothetical protein